MNGISNGLPVEEKDDEEEKHLSVSAGWIIIKELIIDKECLTPLVSELVLMLRVLSIR